MARRRTKSTNGAFKVNDAGTVVGIDPGLSQGKPGALWAERDGVLVETIDMPRVMFDNSSQPFVDGMVVRQFLERHAPNDIIIEMVGSRPGQGVSTTFKFGTNYGVVVGVALATEFRVKLVSPAVWKRRAGLLGMPKDAARILALKLHPEAASELRLKKHGGRADAGLIARYGR